MAVTLNASSTAGFVTTADTSTILQLQTNGTTAVTVDDSQRVAFVAGTAALPAITTTGDTNTGIFFPAADTIAFSEGGAEAMRIDSAGQVGIGTTSPTKPIDVVISGTGDQSIVGFRTTGGGGQGMLLGVNTTNSVTTIKNNSGAYGMAFYSGTGATESMRIDSSGNLLVGTTSAVNTATRAGFYNAGSASPVVGVQNARNVSGDVVNSWLIGSNANNTSSYFLQCGVSGVANVLFIYGNGNVQNTNNSYGAISDVKLKENIVDATPKLADLMQVKVRNYNLIGSTTKQIGVVAQELETIFPAMIDESPDRDMENNVLETTSKSVKYSVFVPMLIKAIQEQQALIETLTQRITALEAK
jgi:hypothetical protein